MSLITWSPTDKGGGTTLSNENLTVDMFFSKTVKARANKGKMSGKHYWEITIDQTQRRGFILGVDNRTYGLETWNMNIGYYGVSGNKVVGTSITTTYGEPLYSGDVLGVALDLDIGEISFFRNGVNQGVALDNLTGAGELFPCISTNGGSEKLVVTANFGATPFQYDVPNGYLPYDIENASWFRKKYLFQCNESTLKPTMNGLEIVEGVLNSQLFEEHGTDYLPNIIGQYDKEVDMIYKENLEGKRLYGYKLIGYTNLSLSSVSSVIMKNKDGEYFTFADEELIKIEQPLTEDKIIDNPIDLEQLTGVTNKEILTMEVGVVKGEGKTFSKKISPTNWNRKIRVIDVK